MLIVWTLAPFRSWPEFLIVLGCSLFISGLILKKAIKIMLDTVPHSIGDGYWACKGDDGIWEVRKDSYSDGTRHPFEDKYNGMMAVGRATTLEKAKALCKAAGVPNRDQLLNSEGS